jgi:hypothetical protein
LLCDNPFNVVYNFCLYQLIETTKTKSYTFSNTLTKVVMAAFGTYIGSVAMLLLICLPYNVCALPIRYATNDDPAIAWLKASKDTQGLFTSADALPMITGIEGHQT